MHSTVGKKITTQLHSLARASPLFKKLHDQRTVGTHHITRQKENCMKNNPKRNKLHYVIKKSYQTNIVSEKDKKQTHGQENFHNTNCAWYSFMYTVHVLSKALN